MGPLEKNIFLVQDLQRRKPLSVVGIEHFKIYLVHTTLPGKQMII